MRFIVESKTRTGENWIDLPEKICSGLERAKDHAWKLVRNAEVPTKARVCVRESDECYTACGFERDADGGVWKR